MSPPLVIGFLLGALAVLVAEGAALYWLLHRLGRKKPEYGAPVGRDLGIDLPVTYPYEKQGVLWILDQDKISKTSSNESLKGAKDQKNKKEIVDVFPVKKNAKVKDHSLILTGQDGSRTTIQLLDCSVVAVSASDLPSRKWYKKYPIRVQSKKINIYNGRKICYLYAETSWEKESWCKALRLASYSNKEKIKWYSQLRQDFHCYLASLAPDYPLFQKPSTGISETTDKSNKIDESSSKVRHFLKRITKKASRIGIDHKTNAETSSSRADRKLYDRCRNPQDISASGPSKYSSDAVKPTSPKSTLSGSQQIPSSSDTSSEEMFGVDEGSLCLNLLLSRIFFDAKRNPEVSSLIKARIQRALSNMRTTSYIGGIACTGLDIGTLPPYIHQMRTLPVDMNEMWAVEIDIEYTGGLILGIETRIAVREPDFQKGIIETNLEQRSTVEVTSELLEEFESYSNQLKSTRSPDGNDKGDEQNKQDELRPTKSGSWTSTYKSRWKTMLNSIADQVSQVPISLGIKVASLRGTLRLHIKPPPSDQIWFGFTSMPEIDLNLDSSVGDHKISSAHVALIIVNRFKLAIRDSLVLPNCESICIPWMLSEKDDWVPRTAAPFIWVRQESSDLPGKEASNSRAITESNSKPDSSKGIKPSSDSTAENTNEKAKGDISAQSSLKEQVLSSVTSELGSTSFSSDELCSNNMPESVRAPVSESYDSQESFCLSRTESTESYLAPGQTPRALEEDAKGRRMGRRARMLDLGKKMGEKLEEKRRHIEEKGRHMVEKMRENSRTNSTLHTNDKNVSYIE